MKVLAIFITLCIVLAGIYVGSNSIMRTVRSDLALAKGDTFIKNLYAEYSIAGSSCQGSDTDDDSYVSCDYRLVSPLGQERIVHLQCPTIWRGILGDSCKESRLILP
jgi:hypothetical protein